MKGQSIKELSNLIKQKAFDLGFCACGIAKATKLSDEVVFLKNWLINPGNGTMHFLERNIEEREDVSRLLTEARSVIVFMYPYHPQNKRIDNCSYKIAKYAYGKDYHDVINPKLKQISDFISTLTGIGNHVFYTDSGPVFEKKWAQLAGLGWIGKNNLIIHPEYGSYVLLGEIITTLELDYDSPMEERCGRCTNCIKACPTHALSADQPYVLNPLSCISYQTIEQKENNAYIFSELNKEWIFGCDICQDVCPFNNKSTIVQHELGMNKAVATFTNENWENLNESSFFSYFKGSSLQRAKYWKIHRNIKSVKKNQEQL